jgi:hypothetical protein
LNRKEKNISFFSKFVNHDASNLEAEGTKWSAIVFAFGWKVLFADPFKTP